MNYNIGDAIIKTLLTIDYTKRKLNHITLFFATLFARSIVNLIISSIFYVDIFFIDFTIEILLSIFLVLKTNIIFNFVKKYNSELYSVSSYLIDNYSVDNFRKWKKYCVVCISVFLIFYLMIYEITSLLLIQYIFQFLICYFIVDNIENKNGFIFNFYDKIKEKNSVKIYKKDDIIIIDEYKKPNDSETILVEDFFVFETN